MNDTDEPQTEPADKGAGDAPGESSGESELGKAIEGLGKTVEGVAGRLFGPKVIGKEALPDKPAISPEADEAIESAGETLGRFLNAAGTAMQQFPTDPKSALKVAQSKAEVPVEAPEGWSELSAGLRSFGGGLFKVAEGVLDQVAPRKGERKHPVPPEQAPPAADEGPEESG